MKAALRPMVTCEYSRLLSLLVGDTRRIRRLANALSRLLAERAVSDLRPPPSAATLSRLLLVISGDETVPKID